MMGGRRRGEGKKEKWKRRMVWGEKMGRGTGSLGNYEHIVIGEGEGGRKEKHKRCKKEEGEGRGNKEKRTGEKKDRR
ncbi:hypothetical protein Tco_1290424 [Tanacetum coccineum]